MKVWNSHDQKKIDQKILKSVLITEEQLLIHESSHHLEIAYLEAMKEIRNFSPTKISKNNFLRHHLLQLLIAKINIVLDTRTEGGDLATQEIALKKFISKRDAARRKFAKNYIKKS